MIQFGIEMEGYGLTKEQIEEVMAKCNASHEGFFRYHGGSNHDERREGQRVWKTEEDGSLRNTMGFTGYGRSS
jgi:superfamily II DNA helicase RecQ